MSVDLESRTKAALRQFDSNMSGIFDRASFYDSTLYSQASYPELTRAQVCFKYTLFAANLLFLIFGCILIAVGSYAVTNSIGALSGATLPTGITVLGVFIVLLSLLGALAAYKEARVFLIIYFVFLLLLTLILFFVGIAVYVERDDIDSLIEQGWQLADKDIQQNLQEIFDCCGCCTADWKPYVTPTFNCSAVTSSGRGCMPVFKDYLASYYVTAGGCGIAFAVFMFLGMILVCFLMDGIKKKRAEQDLAKLRASNNADDADLQLAPHRPQMDQDDDDDDEEDMSDDDEEAAPMRR